MDESSRLTAAELDLVQDHRWFLAKARITGKFTQWLKEVQVVLQEELSCASLLTPADFDPAKVQYVKGEHLEDHPYQYLDCPKHFSGGNTFTIRTLVWWGHHVAIALLLEGEHVARYKQNLLTRYHLVTDRRIALSLGPDFWEWKQGEGYTLPLTRDRWAEVAAVLSSRRFFKLIRFLPFDDPAVVDGRLAEVARETLKVFLPVVTL